MYSGLAKLKGVSSTTTLTPDAESGGMFAEFCMFQSLERLDGKPGQIQSPKSLNSFDDGQHIATLTGHTRVPRPVW